MSDQLFEVAFSGKISEGADLDDVKTKVGKMFSADEAKLAQLFSGKRIVIKKNVDQATATKYKTAFVPSILSKLILRLLILSLWKSIEQMPLYFASSTDQNLSLFLTKKLFQLTSEIYSPMY